MSFFSPLINLICGSLSEESVAFVAVDLVSMGGGEFRILLHYHLDPELGKLMFNVIKIESSYQPDL